MINKSEQKSKPGPESGFYEIQVQGHLDPTWSDWLEGLNMELLENGEMVLSGLIPDQAALMGVLNKLGRLNLVLRSVNQKQQTNDRSKYECKTEE